VEPQRLDELAERLLRAGVAPRHVRRFVRELYEHHEDARSAELARGATYAEAERTAAARMGAEEDLAQSLLARPELRARGARFPALVFGAGPLLLWLAAVIATAMALRLAADALGSESREQPAWVLPSAHALAWFYVRLLPLCLGLAALAASARQRLRTHWAIAGAAGLCLLTGTLNIQVIAAAGETSGQLGVSSTLLPFIFTHTALFGQRDLSQLGQGLACALCMLSLVVASYRLLRARFKTPLSPRSQAGLS